MSKVIILSDLHLMAPGATSHGIDTAARMRAAVAHINRHHADADLCVLAGDLADLGEAGAYRALAELTQPLAMPVIATLGNHDDRAVYLEVTGAAAHPATGCLDHVHDLGDAVLLVLDSLETGRIEGHLSAAQLGWLMQALEAARGRAVVVVLHHDICPLLWPFDDISLAQPAAFVDLLRAHGDVRQVISGHVHTTTSGVIRGVPFTTLCGSHYNTAPRLTGHPGDVPNVEGPGQMAVLLVHDDGVVVHHESFFDRHAVLQP